MGNNATSQAGTSKRRQEPPKSTDQLRARHQTTRPLRRTISEQKNAEFFYNSCPLFLNSQSPLRKRIKLMEDHSFMSLPNNFPLLLATNNQLIKNINNTNYYNNRLAPINEYLNGKNTHSAYCENTADLTGNNRDSLWTDTDDGSYTVNDANSVHSPSPSKSVTFDEKSMKIQQRQQRKRNRKSQLIADFVDIFWSPTKTDDNSPKKMRKICDKSYSKVEANNTANVTSCHGQTSTNEIEGLAEKSPTLQTASNKLFKPKFRTLGTTSSNHRGNKEISACKRKSTSSSLDTPPSKISSSKSTWSWGSSPANNGDPPATSPSEDESIWRGSLNSLTDGRTPWPTPKLDAIFLPEFPLRGLINENSFLTLGTIARGNFGKVYRVALASKIDSIFAMKVQKKSTIIAKDAVRQIKDEISIHQVLGNSNFIAQLHCTWQNRHNLYMVLQYVPGYGDMHQLWKDEFPFDEKVVKIWIAELAMALDFIHGSGIIHRDIKMENILLDDNGHIQLIDFGLAKWLNYGERTSTICGTLQYMAPEVLQGDFYGHGADWWSLGVLMHSLLLGSYPFGVSDSHTTMCITDYTPDEKLSQPAKNLLSKLLRKDPKWRLRSLTLIKNEKFYSDMSFYDVQNKKSHPFDFIPRMKRCYSCNIDDDNMQNLEDCVSVMFDEEYDAFQEFDYFSDDM